MRRALTGSDYRFYPGQGWLCTGCNPAVNDRPLGRISNEGIYRLMDQDRLKNDVMFWLCPLCYDKKIGAN